MTISALYYFTTKKRSSVRKIGISDFSVASNKLMHYVPSGMATSIRCKFMLSLRSTNLYVLFATQHFAKNNTNTRHSL